MGYLPDKGEMDVSVKRITALALLLILLSAIPATAASMRGVQVVSVAMKQVGKPYALHSDVPNSFNCATFVAYCCNQVSSGAVTKSGIGGKPKKITSVKKLEAGDIVCFKTSGSERGILSYHFGIYMGKGFFIHASNSANEVIVSKMKDYSGRYLGAMRVF